MSSPDWEKIVAEFRSIVEELNSINNKTGNLLDKSIPVIDKADNVLTKFHDISDRLLTIEKILYILLIVGICIIILSFLIWSGFKFRK